MVVDPGRGIGWSIGKLIGANGVPNNPVRFQVYDLERLSVTHQSAACNNCPSGGSILAAATDSDLGRAYVPIPPPTAQTSGSPDSGNAIDSKVHGKNIFCGFKVFDYSDPRNPRWEPQPEPYDCPVDLFAAGVEKVPDSDTFLVSGYTKDDYILRRPAVAVTASAAIIDDLFAFGVENLGAALIVRKLSRQNGALVTDWDLDLRLAGCGRRVQPTQFDSDTAPIKPFTAIVGSNLLAYCWDTKPVYWNGGPVGEQGYVVRIPLTADGRPLAPDGSGPAPMDPNRLVTAYRSVRTPALPGYLNVIADPASGLVMLVSQGPVNGNAVWLFDPRADRFIGVATGGFGAQPRRNQAVGVDSIRGRVYMLTQHGVLMVPARQRPLPGGLLFPVGVNEPAAQTAEDASFGGSCPIAGLPSPVCSKRSFPAPRPDWANFPVIPVLPGEAPRLFLPVNRQLNDDTNDGTGAHYLVVEDTIPDLPPPPPIDPDASTTQVEERKGKTEANARGQATASGVHAIAVGGVTRTVDQADPACRTDIPISATQNVAFELEPNFFANEKCAADQVLTPGHREVFLAKTEAEAGSGSGAVARGAGLAFASSDVTTNDVQNLGQCGRGTVANVLRFDPGNPDGQGENGFVTGCSDFHQNVADNGGPDLRSGTRGPDGRGILPAALCGDFGGEPKTDTQGGIGSGPQGAMHGSASSCNAGLVKAGAATTTGALAVPDATNPTLAVASTRSLVGTVKDPEHGQVTVAFATAEGVRIGPLGIREIKSLAITRAHGRTGTANTFFVRLWCGISVIDGDQTDPESIAGQGDCVDPDTDANVQNLIAAFNQGSTKARLTLPPVNGRNHRGEGSDGGFQAVVMEDPDVHAGDVTVNDDDTHTVAGLEAIVYNDGPSGRNRYVVQLAGVHAESRYGIIELPSFCGAACLPPPGETTTTSEVPPSTEPPSSTPSSDLPQSFAESFGPETFFEESFLARGGEVVTTAPVVTRRSGSPVVERILRPIPEFLRGAIELLVSNPREFALLFVVWSLLAAPLYLFLRRRNFARALMVAGA